LVERGDSVREAGIHHAAQKGNSFYDSRGERRLFLIISFSPEEKVNRPLAGARGFLVLIESSGVFRRI
jgi:hypothetical protein